MPTSTQLPDETLETGGAPREAEALDPVLISGLAAAALAEQQLGLVRVWFAGCS